MSANLDSCAEAFRGGVGVQVYYVAADVEAHFRDSARERGHLTSTSRHPSTTPRPNGRLMRLSATSTTC